MNKINKYLPKALSAVLSAVILLSGVGVASYSAGAESVSGTSEAEKAEEKASPKSSENTLGGLSKTETVYVIAKADGTPEKVIVSDWLKNGAGADTIADKSNLEDIKNVKGDETYTINEDKMYEWGANGEDIYYQGTGTAELPVGVSVSCKLDGKSVSAEDLAGADGRVTIRFEYDNRQYETVKINGKDEKIYVPFVMLTGMLLDNDSFRNVEVTNGKVVNDGSHTYVAGFALPGLQESLGIDSEDFKIPDYVEVKADVTDFELSTTLTIATNEVFSDLDTDKLDGKIEELDYALGEMTDAMNQLIDGSSQLYEGLGTLLGKSKDLIDGVNRLYSGAEQLKNGALELSSGANALALGASGVDTGVGALASGIGSVDSGAGSLASGASDLDNGVAQLQGYVAALSGGLGEISANSGELKSGAKQVFDTLLSTADTQIAAAGLSAEQLTVDNYGKVLNGLINSLSDENVQQLAYGKAYETVSAAVNGQRDVIRQAVENEVRKQVTEAVLSTAGYAMSADAYDAAIAAGQIPAEAQAQISTAVSAQMTGLQGTIDSKTEAQISALIEQNMQSDEVQGQISAAAAQAQAGRQSLTALKAQLDSYNKFYQGILSYTAGVDQANAGAQQILGGTVSLKNGSDTLSQGAGQLKSGTGALKSGANQLKNGSGSLKNGAESLKNGASAVGSGAVTLFDGIASLKDGSGALVDGVQQLYDGSMQLNDGLKQFKEEGVDKLVDVVDGDVKGLVDRIKAVSQVSKNYKSYSGIADGMDGNVDFIFKTDGIEN